MPPPPPPDPTTRIPLQWRARHLPSIESESITSFLDQLLDPFGPNVLTAPRSWNEAMLRDVYRDYAKTLVRPDRRQSGNLIVLSSEIPISNLGPHGEWVASNLHAEYVKKLRPKAKYPKRITTGRTDLVWGREADEHLWVGLVLEFKYIKAPNYRNPQKVMAVFREAFYQAAWYLAAHHAVVRTILAAAVLNTSFHRMCLTKTRTLVIEVSDDLASAAAERDIHNLSDLENWDDFWLQGPAHDIMPDGIVDVGKLRILHDLMAQGYVQAASLGGEDAEGVSEGSSPRTPPVPHVVVPFDTPAKVQAAELRERWKRRSQEARSVPPSQRSSVTSESASAGASGSGGAGGPDGPDEGRGRPSDGGASSRSGNGERRKRRRDREPTTGSRAERGAGRPASAQRPNALSARDVPAVARWDVPVSRPAPPLCPSPPPRSAADASSEDSLGPGDSVSSTEIDYKAILDGKRSLAFSHVQLVSPGDFSKFISTGLPKGLPHSLTTPSDPDAPASMSTQA